MLINKRSKFMQFFEKDDGDLYGAGSNEGVPEEIIQDMVQSGSTQSFTEVEGELDEQSQDTDQHETNRQEGTDTTDNETSQADDKTQSDSSGGDEKFDKFVDTLVERLAPQPQESTEPQKSPEEQARLQAELADWLKPVTVTKQHLEKMGFEDPTDDQVATLQAIQEASVINAVRASQLATQQMLQPIQQQVEFMGHHVNSQREAQAVDAFYKTNPELKGKEKVVTMVANQVSEDKAWLQGKSFDQISARVAQETTEFLKGLGVDPSQNQGQTDESSANPSAGSSSSAVPQMQNLGGSGRSSGRSSGGKTEVSGDADIYT